MAVYLHCRAPVQAHPDDDYGGYAGPDTGGYVPGNRVGHSAVPGYGDHWRTYFHHAAHAFCHSAPVLPAGEEKDGQGEIQPGRTYSLSRKICGGITKPGRFGKPAGFCDSTTTASTSPISPGFSFPEESYISSINTKTVALLTGGLSFFPPRCAKCLFVRLLIDHFRLKSAERAPESRNGKIIAEGLVFEL
jgi:hypothetical protein